MPHASRRPEQKASTQDLESSDEAEPKKERNLLDVVADFIDTWALTQAPSRLTTRLASSWHGGMEIRAKRWGKLVKVVKHFSNKVYRRKGTRQEKATLGLYRMEIFSDSARPSGLQVKRQLRLHSMTKHQ